MSLDVTGHVLIERLLLVNVFVVIGRSVEHRKVCHKWVALACDDILRHDLIGAWVCHLGMVDRRGLNEGLDLVVSDLTRV